MVCIIYVLIILIYLIDFYKVIIKDRNYSDYIITNGKEVLSINPIENKLFNNDLIDTAYITDADVIFNENISFDNTVTLGILYYPKYESLWKQTGANFLYVTKERKSFVNKIVNLYQKYVETNNFETISDSMDKSVRADIYGLDQVCMSEIIKNETDFFNLATIENFVS